MKKIFALFCNKKMLLCAYTGFSAGLPLFFILQLVPAWLRVGKVDLKTIGFFTLAQTPYLLKFLWSPLLDKISPFNLGYRKGWLLLSQFALLLIMPIFGWFEPSAQSNWQALMPILCLTFAIAFVSATQDIAIDAYRRELLDDDELANGNSMYINFYRIAGFIPGGLSLILARYYTWSEVFIFTALCFLPMLLITLLIKEPLHQPRPPSKNSLFKDAIKDFFDRRQHQAWLILAFIVMYKMGDSLATSLATPFYIDMQFATEHIGSVAKHAAVWPSIFGAFLGGILITKYGLNKTLWLAGFVQAFSILGFVWLAATGPFYQIEVLQLSQLGFVISFESIGVGMGSTALITFIAKQTSTAFTATQFALFTGVMAIPRTLLNSVSGVLSEHLGWVNFFWLCFILALPGMLLLFKVGHWRD